MFLSPKYDVVRFKSTNIYLNRISVAARNEDNLETVYQAKGIIEQEAAFIKEKSVFADFREDNDEFLRKCFKQDMTYAKLSKLYKRSPETYEKVEEKLYEHYV